MSLFLKLSLLILVTLMMLTGCSVFSPVKDETPATYVISKGAQHPAHKRKSSRAILVTTPETRAVYNTMQIAYSPRPYELNYFIKSTWAETPAEMMLPLIREALTKTGHYRAVGSSATLGHYDYVLNTRISQLLVDFTQRPAVMRFALHADLVRMETARVISSKDFYVALPLTQYSPYGAVVAANRASAIILDRLTHFCLKHS